MFPNDKETSFFKEAIVQSNDSVKIFDNLVYIYSLNVQIDIFPEGRVRISPYF